MTAILHPKPRSLAYFLYDAANLFTLIYLPYPQHSIKERIKFQQIDEKLCVWEHHREDKRKVLKLRSGPRSQFTVGEFTREKRNGFNKKEGPAILFFGDQFWGQGQTMCYLRNLERITSKDGFPFYPSSHLSAALVLEDRPTIVTNHPCKKTETGECRKFNLSICHLESNERNNIGQPGSFIVTVETNRSQGTRKQGGGQKGVFQTDCTITYLFLFDIFWFGIYFCLFAQQGLQILLYCAPNQPYLSFSRCLTLWICAQHHLQGCSNITSYFGMTSWNKNQSMYSDHNFCNLTTTCSVGNHI